MVSPTSNTSTVSLNSTSQSQVSIDEVTVTSTDGSSKEVTEPLTTTVTNITIINTSAGFDEDTECAECCTYDECLCLLTVEQLYKNMTFSPREPANISRLTFTLAADTPAEGPWADAKGGVMVTLVIGVMLIIGL